MILSLFACLYATFVRAVQYITSDQPREAGAGGAFDTYHTLKRTQHTAYMRANARRRRTKMPHYTTTNEDRRQREDNGWTKTKKKEKGWMKTRKLRVHAAAS